MAHTWEEEEAVEILGGFYASREAGTSLVVPDGTLRCDTGICETVVNQDLFVQLHGSQEVGIVCIHVLKVGTHLLTFQHCLCELLV